MDVAGWTANPTITGGPYTYLPLFWMLSSTLIKRNRAVQGRGAALGAVERSGWLGSRWQGPPAIPSIISTEKTDRSAGPEDAPRILG